MCRRVGARVSEGLEHGESRRFSRRSRPTARAMLDRLCQLIEEVVHICRDKSHPAGRRLSGLDRVCGLRPDGSWHLEPIA